MALSGYRWSKDHISSGALDTSFAIENFARQADMDAGRLWLRPHNEADVIEEEAEVVTSMSGDDNGYGNPELEWGLRNLTPLMVAYINSTFFPGGVRSYPATIRTFNRATGLWEYYQAKATKGRYKAATASAGGYDLWMITFRDAVLIDTD